MEHLSYQGLFRLSRVRNVDVPVQLGAASEVLLGAPLFAEALALLAALVSGVLPAVPLGIGSEALSGVDVFIFLVVVIFDVLLTPSGALPLFDALLLVSEALKLPLGVPPVFEALLTSSKAPPVFDALLFVSGAPKPSGVLSAFDALLSAAETFIVPQVGVDEELPDMLLEFELDDTVSFRFRLLCLA